METTATLEAGAAIRWKLMRLTWQALQSAWRQAKLLESAPYGLAAALTLLLTYWLHRTLKKEPLS